MQKVSNILPFFKRELLGTVEQREITSFAYIAINHLLGYSRSDCIINANQQLTSDTVTRLHQIIIDLKRNKPIQYILGKAYFYGLELKVNQHTLIPRPETEELVDWILKEDFESALDIGAGSGCISIALARNSQAKIYALDVSSNALKIARENAEKNQQNIHFIQQDIFKLNTLEAVDLIVSNPPYVLNTQKVNMNNNVLNFEPSLALFVDDKNPLAFYQKISELAFESLNINGKLFFEINEQFGKEIILILSQIGFVDIELKKDVNGKDRMIKSVKK
ncbi:MAG: protein-(glutamine-N5) methyltransferase, release factor-specific [Flavobacteriales bacterium]|nr:protein-(glutamine-N5) methyltransferase, release factor-specific [Flavobacteriales bacterium]|tara:strand:+ start:15810 stop:16643 length:834 start_codon:yes stop_codon:yes gene_type:complete